MGEDSNIAWTDHTFNPWWGCQRVSQGCFNCYAETFAKRIGHGKRLPMIWGAHAERKFFGDAHWNEPRKWNADAVKHGVRRRVFCASMADVFEDRLDLVAPRARLWRLIGETPALDWLLLTKRPQNAGLFGRVAALHAWDGGGADMETWPANIWLGTTVEDQRRADERIPELLKVPAQTRFLSCEPLLESVDLKPFMRWVFRNGIKPNADGTPFALPAVGGSRGVDWVIVGGESGSGARDFRASWARSIVDACKTARVPVFVKQFGVNAYDDITWRGSEPRYAFNDRKGGDWTEWPEEFRVREWPTQGLS